jgi:hypothetical protein
MKRLTLRTAAAGVVWACRAAGAADGMEFCGPNHDGASAERIAKDRPANGF